MPNGKPDPKCKNCGGSGRITLFTWSCECDCVNKSPITEKFIDYDKIKEAIEHLQLSSYMFLSYPSIYD
jgi:hypothetical protein